MDLQAPSDLEIFNEISKDGEKVGYTLITFKEINRIAEQNYTQIPQCRCTYFL